MLGGCIKNKVKIIVDEDGSGHLIVSRIFGKEMVDAYEQQMEQMEMQMPASVQMPEDPFYNEEQIKMEAGQYGPGVEFLKAKKYSRDGNRGYVAVYKFADINEIFVNLDNSQTLTQSMTPSMPGMEAEMQVAEKSENAISFELERDEINKLHVDVPEYPAPKKDAAEIADDAADQPAFDAPETQMMVQQMEATGNPYGITGKETRGEMIKKIMKGLAFSVSLQVRAPEQDADAEHVRTTSKGDNRYVLLNMDMDQMLTDDECIRIMCGDDTADMGPMAGMMSPGGGLQFFSDMNGYKGMTIQTNNFTVSFAGAKEND